MADRNEFLDFGELTLTLGTSPENHKLRLCSDRKYAQNVRESRRGIS